LEDIPKEVQEKLQKRKKNQEKKDLVGFDITTS